MDVGLALLIGGFPLLAEISLTRAQLGLIAGVVLLSVTIMISARRRKGLDVPSPRDYAREQISRLREENGIREDMEELLGRVQDLARDLNAQLDTRFHKIERVLRDADDRIAQLERLIRAADGRPACDVTVTDEGPREKVAAAQRATPPVNPRHAAIYAMAEQGHSPLEIAQATGQPMGEVELILALRPSPGEKSQTLSVCG